VLLLLLEIRGSILPCTLCIWIWTGAQDDQEEAMHGRADERQIQSRVGKATQHTISLPSAELPPAGTVLSSSPAFNPHNYSQRRSPGLRIMWILPDFWNRPVCLGWQNDFPLQ
jgi:hypothetical protein